MPDALHDLLAKLKVEIEHAEAGDLDRDELRRLAGAVEDRLALAQEGGSGAEEHEGLNDRLRDGVNRFEASHPEVAGTMRTIVERLTGLGI